MRVPFLSTRLVRWWASRALHDLQAAFVVAVMAATIVSVGWFQLFRYPEEDFFSFLGRAPGTVATLVSPVLVLTALWLWLRTGKQESSDLKLHRIVIQPIAKSRLLLLCTTAVLTIFAVTGLVSILRTQAVAIRVIDFANRNWRVYPRCDDVQDPEGHCAAPSDVKDTRVLLRLSRHTDRVVIESTGAGPMLREARDVGPSAAEIRIAPPPPTVDPRKLLVIVFSPSASTAASPTHFAEDVTSLLQGSVDDVQFEAPAFPYDDQILDGWKTTGVRPFLTVASEFDGFQLRLSFKIAQTNFAISFAPEKPESSSGAIPLLPFRIPVDRIQPQRFAVAPTLEASIQLKDSYTQQAASTIRLILGIKALADSRLPEALVWLSEPIDGTDRPGDEALRAALSTVALVRNGRFAATRNEIGRAVDSFRRRGNRTGDLLVTGELGKKLPRLLAVAQGAAAARLLLDAMNSALRRDPKTLAGMDILATVFKEAYGDQWVAIVHFSEEYQYYTVDEALRALAPQEKEEMEVELMQSLKVLSSQPGQLAALCGPGTALPDGSVYRPSDMLLLLARKLSSCTDCEKPRWFLEYLLGLVDSCRQRR
jgi:hypothetical protein